MNFLPAGLEDFFEKSAIKEVRLSNPYSIKPWGWSAGLLSFTRWEQKAEKKGIF